MGWPARHIIGLIVTVVSVSVAGCGDSGDPSGPDPNDAIASIIVTPSQAVVDVGSSTQISATVRNGRGETVNTPVAWSSSTPSVAICGPSGLVTGITEGSATIFASAGGHSANAVVTVVDPSLQLVLLTSELPDGILDVAYGGFLKATGGDGSYAWSISAGPLPAGLSLATHGTISGIPTEDGLFNFTVEVESGGQRISGHLAIMVFQSLALGGWLGGSLGPMIDHSIQYNGELLPRNPHLASYIQAKKAMLEEPDLIDKILGGGFFSETAVESMDGRSIPSMIVFPADTMRPGAIADLARSGQIIQVLEGFLDAPWTRPWVRNWYGFQMGHRGGGGTIFMEDRGTYAARGGGTLSHLHDGILAHELAHTYIGHEWLTQFLHLYVHNFLETNSEDVNQWVYFNLENYVSFSPENHGWRVLLDIYQLIGPPAMGRAYHDLYLMGVPYGSELSPAARQTFIDQAPASVRNQVADLALKIG